MRCRRRKRAIYNEVMGFVYKFCLCFTIGTVAAIALSGFFKAVDANKVEYDNLVDGADYELVILDAEEAIDVAEVDDTVSEVDNEDTYYFTVNENRDKFVEQKVNKFVQTKTLTSEDVYSVEPIYNEQNKMVINSRSEAMCLDIRNKSNWTADDFYKVLNEEMYDLVPVAIKMEDELGVNAIYIIAVGANETGWGKHLVGRYNYFNWTFDGINHFNFNSIDDFAKSSIERYSKYYMNESDYANKLGFTPNCITTEVINTKYAIHLSGGTNWQWSNVVSEIMSMLSARLYK